MHPVNGFRPEAGREIQPELDEQEEISRKQYRSERRDRSLVRRASRRGMPVQEIERHLLAVTEFLRLNPEGDPLAYVRGLIEEDGNGLGSLELGTTRAGQPSANSSATHSAASQRQAAQSEAAARRYIQENFEATDWLAVVVRKRATNQTVQRITTAQQIASPEFQSWLRYKNAHGFEIYLSLNTLKEHASGRTKRDVKEIRHLYLDLDRQGQQKLAALYQDPAVPYPNYVLQTSADKYQVVWRVEGLQQNQAEDLLRGLALRFGGDPAATDATRVFRLPGFNNKKYERDFPVKLTARTRPEPVYRGSNFKIESPPHEPWSADRTAAPAQRDGHPQSPNTQSERDWAYAIRRLREGMPAENIVREIASYRATDRLDPQDSRKRFALKKPSPRYYAEHTVARAMAHLGMRRVGAEKPADQGDRRSPEVEPER